MKKLLFLLLCVSPSLMALPKNDSQCETKVCQEKVDENQDVLRLKSCAWTDGFEFVKYCSAEEEKQNFGLEVKDEQALILAGGTLHEGGTLLLLEPNKHSFRVAESEQYQWFSPGDRLEFSSTKEVILVKEKQTNELRSILKSVSGKDGLEQMMIQDMLRFGLAGKYHDRDGKTYAFSATECVAEGFPVKDQSFSFGRLFDLPRFVLEFDEITYSVNKTPKGLVLVPVRFVDEQDHYEQIVGAKVLELTRDNSSETCVYPLLSEEYLTKNELVCYAGSMMDVTDYLSNETKTAYLLQALSKMRKELLDRQADDSKAALSEMERSNLELIRVVEKEYQSF